MISLVVLVIGRFSRVRLFSRVVLCKRCIGIFFYWNGVVVV